MYLQVNAKDDKYYPLVASIEDQGSHVPFKAEPSNWLPLSAQDPDVVTLVKENAEAGALYVPMLAVSGPAVRLATQATIVLWLYWLVTPAF